MSADQAAVSAGPTTVTVRCFKELSEPGWASLAERSTWRPNNPGPRVRIDIGEQSTYLRVAIRPSAEGEDVIVAPGTLGLTEGKEAQGQMRATTDREARRHWLFHSTDGNLTVTGLALAVAAEFDKLTLTLGQRWPVIDVGVPGVVIANIASTVFTAAGLVLVVWKGLLTEH